jgi:hypothetical protein
MLIYANPSTPPAKRRKRKASPATPARNGRKKGALLMAKRHRSAAQKAATRKMLAANKSRKRHRNPAPRKATRRRRAVSHNPVSRRRRTHRNPSTATFGRGILGELASKDGLMLLGAAAVAPTVVDFVADKIVPTQYASGWVGLIAKATIAAAGAYALDRFLKQRKAAIGFAVGAGGSLIAQAYKTYMVQTTLPTVTPAQGDEIAKNPALYRTLMDGDQYASLNGYAAAPMGGYDMTPMGDQWESLN